MSMLLQAPGTSWARYLGRDHEVRESSASRGCHVAMVLSRLDRGEVQMLATAPDSGLVRARARVPCHAPFLVPRVNAQRMSG